MLEFRCADAGTVCPAILRAYSKEELLRQVADHLSRQHRVRTPTGTILNYMVGLAKTVEEPVAAGNGR